MPYILQEALVAHNTGTPMLRPTFFEYPEDFNAYAVDTQYFLGSNLLVAPVFSESGEVRFYVPEGEGEWVSWFDRKKRYNGGRWYVENHSFFSLPLLIRPGTATVINPHDISDPGNGLEILVNGPITETISLDMVNPDQPDQVKGVITVSLGENGNGGVVINGDGLGEDWVVSYLGKAAAESGVQPVEKEGVTQFRPGSKPLAIRVFP